MSDTKINDRAIINGLMAICKQKPQSWHELANFAKSLRRSYVNIEGKQSVYRKFNELYLGAKVCETEEREANFSSEEKTHASIIKAWHIGIVVDCFISCSNALTEVSLASRLVLPASVTVADAQDVACLDIYDECVIKLNSLKQRSISAPQSDTMIEIAVEEAGIVPHRVRQTIRDVLMIAAGKPFVP